jgi:hypothetical protein
MCDMHDRFLTARSEFVIFQAPKLPLCSNFHPQAQDNNMNEKVTLISHQKPSSSSPLFYQQRGEETSF